MRTVPLYGKTAAGRVALVDDEDYDLVMQHRWHVREIRRAGRVNGPYAITYLSRRDHAGKAPPLFMHVLIMGRTGVDHFDHDGLNNQRSNLRPATGTQNGGNRRKQVAAASSSYKGVTLVRGTRWRAHIGHAGKHIHLGYFPDEESAARAYDRAARRLFGPFACTNFDAEGRPAEQAQRQAECGALEAAREAEVREAFHAVMSDWWQKQQPVTRVCTVCDAEYQSRAWRSLYCGKVCRRRAEYQRSREREQQGTLF